MNGHNTKKTSDHDSQATTCWNSKFRLNPIDCDLKLKLDFKKPLIKVAGNLNKLNKVISISIV